MRKRDLECERGCNHDGERDRQRDHDDCCFSFLQNHDVDCYEEYQKSGEVLVLEELPVPNYDGND